MKQKEYIIISAQRRFRREYKNRKRWKNIQKAFAWSILVLFLIISSFTSVFALSSVRESVTGTTIPGNSLILTNRLAYVTHEIDEGDVITVRYEDAGCKKKLVTLRVIALPGDRVECSNGEITINGKRTFHMENINDEKNTESFTVVSGTCLALADSSLTSENGSQMINVVVDSIAGRAMWYVSLPKNVINSKTLKLMEGIGTFSVRTAFCEVLNRV